MGAWLSYGLGSANENMPSYIVMISRGKGNLQALYSRLWGSGFLPAEHQGVKLRGSGDPILYLANPDGITRSDRRKTLDGLAALNAASHDRFGDPEIQARIAQYEMAFRMQAAAPDALRYHLRANRSTPTSSTARTPAPRAPSPPTASAPGASPSPGVRFIQLFHRGWDQHGHLSSSASPDQCKAVDQASPPRWSPISSSAACSTTPSSSGAASSAAPSTSRAPIPDRPAATTTAAASQLLARRRRHRSGGIEYGRTDDHCYNILENPVHIRDLNATILQSLGIDHERLTFPYQGLDQKLTGVEHAKVVHDLFRSA